MNIAIWGMGRVGSALAYAIVSQGLCDQLQLVNRTHRIAQGEAMDLAHSTAITGHRMTITAVREHELRGADIVAICASAPLPKNKTVCRMDLAESNAALFRSIIAPIAQANPNAILLIITNPVDVMTFLTFKLAGFPPSRVMGVGTLLDSARYRAALSDELGVHSNDLRVYVLGEHGPTQFPAMSWAHAGGEPIAQDARSGELFEQVADSGDRILELKGVSNYAIAAVAAKLIEAVATDAHATFPVCTYLSDYLGVNDVCLSAPAVVGRSGVVRLLKPRLSKPEQAALIHSAKTVRAHLDRLGFAE